MSQPPLPRPKNAAASEPSFLRYHSDAVPRAWPDTCGTCGEPRRVSGAVQACAIGPSVHVPHRRAPQGTPAMSDIEQATTVSAVWLNQLRSEFVTVAAQRDQLQTEVEALRLDAARYRHLRKAGLVLDGHDFISHDEIADSRVDAAIAKG